MALDSSGAGAEAVIGLLSGLSGVIGGAVAVYVGIKVEVARLQEAISHLDDDMKAVKSLLMGGLRRSGDDFVNRKGN